MSTIDWAAIAQGYSLRLEQEAGHLTMEEVDFIMACRRFAESRIPKAELSTPKLVT